MTIHLSLNREQRLVLFDAIMCAAYDDDSTRHVRSFAASMCTPNLTNRCSFDDASLRVVADIVCDDSLDDWVAQYDDARMKQATRDVYALLFAHSSYAGT